MAEKKTEAFSRARKKIEIQIEQAEVERQRHMKRQKIEFAKSGTVAYQAGKFKEAAIAFQSYIKVLENLKGVSSGGLKPSHFDQKKDLPELLLISGIYLDLARIFDHTKSRGKSTQLQGYLNKFVEFSKGMPYQPLCAETLRKFYTHGSTIHTDAFKGAYRAIGGNNKCFIASTLIDVTPVETLPRLRVFRDRVLRKGRWGRVFTAWYYRNGPTLAEGVDRLPDFARKWLGILLDIFSKIAEPR